MIIDKNNPDHAHIPHTLDGEVLLEITKDSNGRTTGFATATKQVVSDYKNATPAERIKGGWDKHQSVVDKIPDNDLPTPRAILQE